MSKRPLEDEVEEGEIDGISSCESSSEDEEYMQHAALPVQKFEGDKPMTGEQYLYMVRAERIRLPKVVTADIPVGPLKVEDLFKDKQIAVPKPSSVIPDDAWEEDMIKVFKQDRAAWKDLLEASADDEDKVELPSTNDEQSWKRFLYGRETEGREPTRDIFNQLGHVSKMRLLLYHSRWASTEGKLVDRQYRWVYSLLCVSLEGLSSEDVSILRSLAKECISLRDKAQEDDLDYLANLNAVIRIVRAFYKQLDLL